MLQVVGCNNAATLPSLSVMVMVVCLLVPSWRAGCPGGRVSSTVNCSGPSRAKRSSITGIDVQAVSFPVGKINVLETCSKSVPPGRIEKQGCSILDTKENSLV